jgi:hypothetical protein
MHVIQKCSVLRQEATVFCSHFFYVAHSKLLSMMHPKKSEDELALNLLYNQCQVFMPLGLRDQIQSAGFVTISFGFLSSNPGFSGFNSTS